MRRLCALLILVALPLTVVAQSNQETAVVLTHVTIIDGTGAAPKLDMTVVISGNRIIELGKSGRVRVPKTAQVIDARGKFLIPGLWDMHVHAWSLDFHKLMVANGVTGVRDMFGGIAQIQNWRKQAQEGKLTIPRIIAAGPIVDGPKPVWPGSIGVSSEAEAREAVRKVKNDGSDFVKVYSLLPREAYFAIADEAKKQGLAFAGHVPMVVRASEASDAGQRSMEHLIGILPASSTKEDAMMKETVDALQNPDASIAVLMKQLRPQTKIWLDTYSEDKARALFARFVKNGTYQVPTLAVLRSITFINDPEFTNDPRMKYVSSFEKKFWQNSPLSRPRPAEQVELDKQMFQKYLEVVGAMRRAGVEILAGTDLGNPYIFAGFSLHDELALLVKAGLTPMEALEAATRNPARFLGKLDTLGTVEKGKLADLVLLDASPLADITNTQKIDSVILNGRLIPKSELQKMMAEVEEAANKK